METLAQTALNLNALALKGYDSPREAMKELSAMRIPDELQGLRDAILTHLIWCKHAEKGKTA